VNFKQVGFTSLYSVSPLNAGAYYMLISTLNKKTLQRSVCWLADIN